MWNINLEWYLKKNNLLKNCLYILNYNFKTYKLKIVINYI